MQVDIQSAVKSQHQEENNVRWTFKLRQIRTQEENNVRWTFRIAAKQNTREASIFSEGNKKGNSLKLSNKELKFLEII